MGTLGGNVSLRVGVNPPICSHWCTKTHMCFTAPCRELYFYTAQRRDVASPRRKRGLLIKASSPPRLLFSVTDCFKTTSVCLNGTAIIKKSSYSASLPLSPPNCPQNSDHKIIFVFQTHQRQTLIFPEPPEITSKCDYLNKTDQMLQL